MCKAGVTSIRRKSRSNWASQQHTYMGDWTTVFSPLKLHNFCKQREHKGVCTPDTYWLTQWVHNGGSTTSLPFTNTSCNWEHWNKHTSALLLQVRCYPQALPWTVYKKLKPSLYTLLHQQASPIHTFRSIWQSWILSLHIRGPPPVHIESHLGSTHTDLILTLLSNLAS